MKVYLSEKYKEMEEKFGEFEKVNYDEADNIVILPGGLSSLMDMIHGIVDKKNVYIYNMNSCYNPILSQFDKLHAFGFEKRMPEEYVSIDTDIDVIIKRLEEKKNVIDGETSKLL